MPEDGRLTINPFSVDEVLVFHIDYPVCRLSVFVNDKAKPSRHVRVVLVDDLASLQLPELAEVVAHLFLC